MHVHFSLKLCVLLLGLLSLLNFSKKPVVINILCAGGSSSSLQHPALIRGLLKQTSIVTQDADISGVGKGNLSRLIWFGCICITAQQREVLGTNNYQLVQALEKVVYIGNFCG